MNKKQKLAVFIGRFQPFHNGHKRVIDDALKTADNVLVLVGSANISRSARNPFTFAERQNMIRGTYPNNFNIGIAELPDTPYNDAKWLDRIKQLVGDTASRLDIKTIALVGCDKDHTSYYLKMFPAWENEVTSGDDDGAKLHATDIRELYYGYGATGNSWSPHTGKHTSPNALTAMVPVATLEFLQKFQESEHFAAMKEEFQFLQSYKKTVADFPRIEHTVDAIVTQNEHLLVIKRKSPPGKNLLALPGGFVGEHERLEDAMIRELREETQIGVPDEVLRNGILINKSYDNPTRSARGRIITQAYFIYLPESDVLPEVKGGDDAASAHWCALSGIKSSSMYEDHYFIVEDIMREFTRRQQ